LWTEFIPAPIAIFSILSPAASLESRKRI
jgi:hypothetical protein